MPVSEWEEETEAALAASANEGDNSDTKRVYVRRIFSQIAPRYDLLNHLLSFNIDKAWRRRAIATLEWQRAPAGTYVDLCAGTLDVAVELSRQPGFRGHVVGADFAEPMLRAGLGKASRSLVGPVVADALELPLRADSVSGATVAFGIRNVADLDAALREVRRVLEPGARFVILEFTTPRSAIVRGLYHLYFHQILPRVGAVVSGHATAYRYLPRSVANFPAEEELAARMQSAGFADVRWQSLTFGIAAIHSGTKR
ncbi:MAG TPA: bifunctional demethylmenaquinone methyltransferase/2-methoxy-6-polyprenyl-1,4-benzoquinol methylase UbiE [Gemmatimonadaceae bacterium]|nr:bifunctional demethylmenaquinone methyltransferase/2-methoxy-6-polyprenyl-1,4-benzoquinol methylase UbiE [Gemmatimonadaceae bacterium]